MKRLQKIGIACGVGAVAIPAVIGGGVGLAAGGVAIGVSFIEQAIFGATASGLAISALLPRDKTRLEKLAKAASVAGIKHEFCASGTRAQWGNPAWELGHEAWLLMAEMPCEATYKQVLAAAELMLDDA